MAVPTKDAILPNDAPESLCLEKHIDFIAKYGQVINFTFFKSWLINLVFIRYAIVTGVLNRGAQKKLHGCHQFINLTSI